MFNILDIKYVVIVMARRITELGRREGTTLVILEKLSMLSL